jgi:hypothetical protein
MLVEENGLLKCAAANRCEGVLVDLPEGIIGELSYRVSFVMPS